MTEQTAVTAEALPDLQLRHTAAAWVVNMPNSPERSRLYNGRYSRAVETMKDGYRYTDYTEADSWLCAEYAAAHQTVTK